MAWVAEAPLAYHAGKWPMPALLISDVFRIAGWRIAVPGTTLISYNRSPGASNRHVVGQLTRAITLCDGQAVQLHRRRCVTEAPDKSLRDALHSRKQVKHVLRGDGAAE